MHAKKEETGSQSQFHYQRHETSKKCTRNIVSNACHVQISKEKARALPNNSDDESEQELEYPGKGAMLVDWKEYHNQQMRVVDQEIKEANTLV